MKNRHILYSILAVACTMVIPLCTEGQTYIETFGQNRIQLRRFNWQYFDTRHFRIYHYDKAGKQLARYVSEEAERDIHIVEQKLGSQFPRRFNIILYNNYEEYRQTNVGLKNESQAEGNNSPAGKVNIVDDKLVVYFTGVHTDLRRQIRAGMSTVVMQKMIFGESFRQMVKNALLLNLPEWVTEGYISYLVDGWDTKSNTDWKNLMEANPKMGFYELSEKNPELAGKAFWKFVSEQYGKSTVKYLLYSMQQKSSLNQGMNQPQTLNMKVRQAYDSCIHFYKQVYAGDALKQDMPDSTKGILDVKAPNDNTVMRNLKISPKGKDVAYVAWKDGEYFVYLQRVERKEVLRSLLLEGGKKDFNEQADLDYPILTWSNNGYKLAILYKKENELRLRIYNSLKAKIENYVIPAKRFDRVLGISFLEDDNQLVFSAIKNSQTDLYEFTIKRSKFQNITNDLWDDVQPWFVSGGSRQGILFLSNRPKANLDAPLEVNQLPTGPMNVYFYDTKSKRKELLQCSNVTTGNVSQPIQYGSENFAFLYDSNGVQNKYVVLFGRDKKNRDSAYAVPITNYAQNIVNHQYNPASNSVADVLQVGGNFKIFYHELQMPGKNVQAKNLLPTTLSKTRNEDIAGDNAIATLADKGDATSDVPMIKSGNAFQSEFRDEAQDSTKGGGNESNVKMEKKVADETPAEPVDSALLNIINDSTYIKMKPAQYRLSMKPDFFSVRLDNSVLFNQYQSLQNNGGSYSNPSLGGLFTISMNDLMENHRFTAGFQLPINMSGSAYFLQYDNFTRRVDWGLLFLRTQNTYSYLVSYTDNSNRVVWQAEQPGKSITSMLQSNFSYPFDRIRSLRFHTALRLDQLHLAPVDTISLVSDLPSNLRDQYWSLSRLEYVYDNTTNPFLNIRNGVRYKVYGEYLYRLNDGKMSCYNFGVDFRLYQKIYKNFIWAGRLAYAHSDGNAQVMYSLGGVDNWIGASSDNSLQPTGGPYSFQAIATNLRGYEQNARAGNNYAVFNSEFRLPVLTTFLKRPIQSAFLRNFQLIAFLDAGSAWGGFLPDAYNTTRNYYYASNSPTQPINVLISVPNSAGLGLGYGCGVRTSLFGYFMRLDAAWNIDGRVKPIWYFSLGTDF